MRTLPAFGGRTVGKLLSILFAIALSACSTPTRPPAPVGEPVKPMSAPPAKPVAEDAGVVVSKLVVGEPTLDPSAIQAAPAAKEPEKFIPHIALLVPLASKTLGKVADALKLGFLAGAQADGQNARAYRIYTSDDEGASLAVQYRKAVAEGASAIVGGLTRDGAHTMAREARLLPTLALNAPLIANDAELPDRFFYISLSLDVEARLVARMAFAEGLRSLAMVVANSPLDKRVQETFEQEWMRQGGSITARISFGNDPNDANRVSSSMERLNERAATKTDAIFLAADPAAARFVRPYLPTGMPVFATSHTVDPRAEAVANLDLESVRFLEMPWFVESDHPAVMAYPKPQLPMPIEFERLYALGIDAWRLGQMVASIESARGQPLLDGVTGRITLEGRQFTRALTSVEVRDGRAQLYRPAE
ncbi:MAG: penicillin-binding protein activator [Betaproteobacteria bacterium]